MEKKALIVDDDGIVREILAALLAELRCDSDSTESPGQALAMLEAKRYDVVFTDYQMPGMNGIELSRKVREISPHSAVILMTGNLQSDLMCRSGADGFLQKPFSSDTLRESLARVLGSSPG